MTTTKTLKALHESKKVFTLAERVKTIDANLLKEERSALLIIEAIDENDLEKVTAIIDKLRKLKRPELPALKSAIEQAEAELNKYTAGGPLTKAWTKMKGLVGIDNPVVKIATFASALEKGFSQIPQILKNNGIDQNALKSADLTQSLATYVAQQNAGKLATKATAKTGAKSDAEMAKSPFTGKQVEGQQISEADDSSTKLKSITDQIRKALAPSGVFGAFKKIPYVNGDALVQDLMKAPLGVFSLVAKNINQGTKVAEIAPDLKAYAQGQGGTETKGSAQGEETKPSSSSTQTTTSTPTTATSKSVATGEKTPSAPGSSVSKKAVDDVVESGVAKRFNISGEALEAIVSTLVSKGHIK